MRKFFSKSLFSQRRFRLNLLQVVLMSFKVSSSILSCDSYFILSWFKFSDCRFLAFFNRGSLPVLMKYFSFYFLIFNNNMLNGRRFLIWLLCENWEFIFHISESLVSCDNLWRSRVLNDSWFRFLKALFVSFEYFKCIQSILLSSWLSFMTITSLFTIFFFFLWNGRARNRLGLFLNDVIFLAGIQRSKITSPKVISHGYVPLYIIYTLKSSFIFLN